MKESVLRSILRRHSMSVQALKKHAKELFTPLQKERRVCRVKMREAVKTRILDELSTPLFARRVNRVKMRFLWKTSILDEEDSI